MIPAVEYLRMSTDRQEHSIEAQRRLVREFAERNNYTIVHSYTDEGISGRSAEKRPAFMQMIDDSENGTFEAVLIYDSSRFARNLKDAIVYKAILKSHNIELVSITEPMLDDDNALITDAIMGAVNEMYSRKLSKNVKRGLEQKAIRHESMTKPPFGYFVDTPSKPMQIVESEAATVRYVFEAFKGGTSAYNMARKLSSGGVLTKRGNLFDLRQVEYILTNPIYKGWMKLTVNGSSYCSKSNHPAIISEELFEEVQEIYKKKKAARPYNCKPKEWYRHWLSGLVKCSICGSSYAYSPSYGGRSDNYRCLKRAKGACANNRVISVPKLNKIVIDELKAYADNPHLLCSANVSFAALPVVDYNGQTKKVEASLSRAKEAFLNGVDTLEEYKATKQILEQRLSLIKKENDRGQEARSLDTNKLARNIASTIAILESDKYTTPQKIDASRSILEKVVLDGETRIVTLYFVG